MSTKTIHNTTRGMTRRRFCVIFPGALGDFICFLPALQALSRRAEIDLFARSEFCDIAPGGVNVRSLECSEIGRLFVADCDDDRRLEKFFGNYQEIYSWMGSQQERFVGRLRSLVAKEPKIFPFRAADSEVHQTDYYLSCLPDQAAVPSGSEIHLSPEAIHWCNDFWTRHSLLSRSVLVIAPGSGAREKNWPQEYFFAVAEWWRRTVAGTPILLLGPVEVERGGVDSLHRICLIARDLTLSQAAALLHRSDLYLGNDSGMSHLAAATGARTVALFGPSNDGQWAPRGRNVSVLRRRVECSPCETTAMKRCAHRKCLTKLSPSDVIDHLSSLLFGRYLDKVRGRD